MLVEELLLAEPFSVELGVEPHADEIVAALFFALGQELFVERAELHERLGHLLGDVLGPVAPQDDEIGDVEHLVVALEGIAEHVADDAHGKRAGDVAHQIAFAAAATRSMSSPTMRADLRLELGDAARREAFAHQPALARVLFPVEVDHRLVGPHLEVDAGDHAETAAEDLGVLGDEGDVVVAGYGPQLLGVSEERRLLAQPFVERLGGQARAGGSR